MSECRICLDGDSEELGDLISPCKCSGSQNYIHEQCLQRWRDENIHSEKRNTCEICKTKYQIIQDHLRETYVIKIYRGPWLLPIVYLYCTCGIMGLFVCQWDFYYGFLSIHLFVPDKLNGRLLELVKKDEVFNFMYYTAFTNYILATLYIGMFGVSSVCYIRRFTKYWRKLLPHYLTHYLVVVSHFFLILYISCMLGSAEFALSLLFALGCSTGPFMDHMHMKHNSILHGMNSEPNNETVLSIEDVV